MFRVEDALRHAQVGIGDGIEGFNEGNLQGVDDGFATQSVRQILHDFGMQYIGLLYVFENRGGELEAIGFENRDQLGDGQP